MPRDLLAILVRWRRLTDPARPGRHRHRGGALTQADPWSQRARGEIARRRPGAHYHKGTRQAIDFGKAPAIEAPCVGNPDNILGRATPRVSPQGTTGDARPANLKITGIAQAR